MKKINNIDELLIILGKLIPHYQHNLLLTWEIIDRKLKPMDDLFRSYKNIAKNEKDLIEKVAKNTNYKENDLKYFIELTLRQKDIDNQLILIKLILDFLVKKKIIEGYYDTSKRSNLDDIKTYDKDIQKLQRKDTKENEKS